MQTQIRANKLRHQVQNKKQLLVGVQALWAHNFFGTKGTNMNGKQLTIEDVIRRMNEVMREENSSKPTKMLVTPDPRTVFRCS